MPFDCDVAKVAYGHFNNRAIHEESSFRNTHFPGSHTKVARILLVCDGAKTSGFRCLDVSFDVN